MNDASSDQSLMEHVATGDERSFVMLYDRHASMVYSLARAILRRDQDAEEVTEDVFVQLWSAPARFDESRGALRSYLATMTRSRALDRVRARTRRDHAHERASVNDETGVASPLSEPEAPDERVTRSEERAWLAKALDHLSEAQRRAIELAYFEGLSQTEIAQRLAEPLGTVKTRIRDGMAKLRDLFLHAEGVRR